MNLMRSQLTGGTAFLLLLLADPVLADEANEAAKKPPQVRTYTSVTVVSDPSQAPRLPSRVADVKSERPSREERGEVKKDRVRENEVRELRQEVKELRRDLRESVRDGRENAARPTPSQRQPAHERPGPNVEHERARPSAR